MSDTPQPEDVEPTGPTEPTEPPEPAEPIEAAAPTGPTNPRTRNRWRTIGVVGAVAILAIAVAAVLLLRSGHSSKPFTVNGTMTLTDLDYTGITAEGGLCAAATTGGYSDIAQGAQVRVEDEASKLLAVGMLSSGAVDADGHCAFTFAVQLKKGPAEYQFEVSHRGQLSYTYDQLAANLFTVAFTLGG